MNIDNNKKLFEFMLKTLYFLKEKIIKKKRLNSDEKTAIIKGILSSFCFKIKTYNGNLTPIDLNYEHVLTIMYGNKFKDNDYQNFLHKVFILTGFNNHLINVILVDYDIKLNFFEKQLLSYEGFKKGFKKTISYYSEPELNVVEEALTELFVTDNKKEVLKNNFYYLKKLFEKKKTTFF